MSKKADADMQADAATNAGQADAAQNDAQAAAESKPLAQPTDAATKPQFTREQLEAIGLDPAPYGL